MSPTCGIWRRWPSLPTAPLLTHVGPEEEFACPGPSVPATQEAQRLQVAARTCKVKCIIYTTIARYALIYKIKLQYNPILYKYLGTIGAYLVPSGGHSGPLEVLGFGVSPL